MNGRIKKLWEQAEKYADANFKGEPFWSEAYESKFAELIVRECAQVCRDQPNHYALKADRDNCAVAIEEHFGVEE
jgi:hypothetical protein